MLQRFGVHSAAIIRDRDDHIVNLFLQMNRDFSARTPLHTKRLSRDSKSLVSVEKHQPRRSQNAHNERSLCDPETVRGAATINITSRTISAISEDARPVFSPLEKFSSLAVMSPQRRDSFRIMATRSITSLDSCEFIPIRSYKRNSSGLGRHGNRAQRIIDFMCNTSRQNANVHQALRPHEPARCVPEPCTAGLLPTAGIDRPCSSPRRQDP